MRKLLLYIFYLVYTYSLIGCTTTTSETPVITLKKGHAYLTYLTTTHPVKMGHRVAFYPSASSITHPYRIIGKETISRYNLIGFERQAKTLDELLKNLAASMGGDAVINITADKQKIEGTVVSFEKVML